MSNGVRQGSVLSSILFCIYLDGLLEALSDTSVGCHWGGYFAGVVCYADDIVLLAPSASTLQHIMLRICESFASSHGLLFNGCKTQLICFHSPGSDKQHPTIIFNNAKLHYSDSVKHLGHILTSNLDDREYYQSHQKLLIVKPILYSANFMLLTTSSNVILLNLTVYLCMEPHYGLCHLLHYASLKLLLTKFYVKLEILITSHTLESPIALREFLLSVIYCFRLFLFLLLTCYFFS